MDGTLLFENRVGGGPPQCASGDRYRHAENTRDFHDSVAQELQAPVMGSVAVFTYKEVRYTRREISQKHRLAIEPVLKHFDLLVDVSQLLFQVWI